MQEFISEDDLHTFEGWLRYQGFDVATTSSPLTRLLMRRPLSFFGPHPKHVPFGA